VYQVNFSILGSSLRGVLCAEYAEAGILGVAGYNIILCCIVSSCRSRSIHAFGVVVCRHLPCSIL
jgi:hypothetical protein